MSRYYVYQLIDPRTNLPFYVGKGTGNRIDSHEKSARSGEDHPRCERIREIESLGMSIKKEIVKEFNSENAAYNFEKKLIAKIGLKNLTNLSAGGKGSWAAKPRNERKSNASAFISVIATLYRKADGKEQCFWNFCGERFQLPKRIFEAMDKKVLEFISEFGESYVKDEFDKHNVSLRIVRLEAAQSAPVYA